MQIDAYLLLAAALSVACFNATSEADSYRCDDVSTQIEEAHQRNLDAGILLPGADPCLLTPDDFDPRAAEDVRDLLLEDFANACQIQQDVCSDARVTHDHRLGMYGVVTLQSE
jgi:hypothetical protein